MESTPQTVEPSENTEHTAAEETTISQAMVTESSSVITTVQPTVQETTSTVEVEQTTKTITPDDITTSSSAHYKLSLCIALLSVSVFLIGA